MEKIVGTDFFLCKHAGENVYEVKKRPFKELDFDETFNIFYHKEYGCYLILDFQGRYINLDIIKAGAWRDCRICGMHLLWKKDYQRSVKRDEMAVY
ncbi:MAG: hypothetical protein ACM3S2_22160 [Ignavibacteriales bacterium]